MKNDPAKILSRSVTLEVTPGALLGMKSRTLNKYTTLTFHIKDEGLVKL